MSIESKIRAVPDYPKKGIMFRDITTLLKDSVGLKDTLDSFVARYKTMAIDKVAGIESRGFILGAPLAYLLGVGFVPVRKTGKLPAETVGVDYQLEYGSDRLEMHTDSLLPGEKVLLVDDLVATGGTASASAKLIEQLGGEVLETCFIVDLPDLGGSKLLRDLGYNTFSLCEFEGD
jgi:adenine phosphoribosyltransferase